MFLMHDVNVVINNEQGLTTALAFVAKLWCSMIILRINLFSISLKTLEQPNS